MTGALKSSTNREPAEGGKRPLAVGLVVKAGRNPPRLLGRLTEPTISEYRAMRTKTRPSAGPLHWIHRRAARTNVNGRLRTTTRGVR
jgi:hypothetical protein